MLGISMIFAFVIDDCVRVIRPWERLFEGEDRVLLCTQVVSSGAQHRLNHTICVLFDSGYNGLIR